MDDCMSISKEQLEIAKSVGNFNIEPYSGQITVDQDCVKLDLNKDIKGWLVLLCNTSFFDSRPPLYHNLI